METISSLVQKWYYQNAKVIIAQSKLDELKTHDLTVRPAESYRMQDLEILLTNNHAIKETTEDLSLQRTLLADIEAEILEIFLSLGVGEGIPVLCQINLGPGYGYEQNVRVSYNALKELAFNF